VIPVNEQLTGPCDRCHPRRVGTGERVGYQTIGADSARWDGFMFRPDDIVISTPAKCGATWMQTICALEVSSARPSTGR
jgi:hypothetical protein